MASLLFMRNTKIRVLNDDDTLSKLVPVADLKGTFKVVDWYGEVHEACIEGAESTPRRMLRALSGETTAVGVDHMLLCRLMGSGKYERVRVGDMDRGAYVRLPQRKIEAEDFVVDYLNHDKEGLFLQPETPAMLMKLMEAAATCGVSVQRDKAILKIYLEKGRPSCFAAKLLNGNFQSDLEDTLGGLVSKAIVQPHGRFNDAYLEKTKQFGTIFEGSSLYNDTMVVATRITEDSAPCIKVSVDADTPIETAWFCT